MECISRINLGVIGSDLGNVLRSSEYFQNLILPFKDMDVAPAILDIIDKNGDQEKLKINIEWLPIHLIDIVSTARQKNF